MIKARTDPLLYCSIKSNKKKGLAGFFNLGTRNLQAGNHPNFFSVPAIWYDYLKWTLRYTRPDQLKNYVFDVTCNYLLVKHVYINVYHIAGNTISISYSQGIELFSTD